jgi:transposase
MQLDTITELLGIPNYKVTHVIHRDGSSLHFIVDRIHPLPPVCSNCGCVHTGGVHSVGVIMVEDLPISGKRVFLHVPRRKVLCVEDGTIRVEEIDWISKRFTLRFAEQVYRLTAIATNQEAGWYLGLDDETVYRIDKGMLEKLAREKLDSLAAPTMMSVDEVSWRKRHKYVTNVIDMEKRKVIWNHNSCGRAVLDKFYRKLGQKGCERIQAVASDGAKGFLSSTKAFAKNALIVLDHFHVKKSLNDALDKVRKEELRKAQKEHNDELSRILHCNQRFILMQSKTSKRKENVLNKLAVLNERIYQAMLLKEQFLSVYKAKNRKTARTNLKEWIIAAMKSKISAFVELGNKFFRKRHFILNYFVCNITTAISEGINNKIKRLSRMAYGFRDVYYFLLKIHQHCGLLNPRTST